MRFSVVWRRRLLAVAYGIGFLFIVVLWGLNKLDEGFGPVLEPRQMPSVVEQTMEELLAQYESLLATHVPEILENLQTGLSVEEIHEIETDAGLTLTDDLRTLYSWRNGLNQSSSDEFFGMYTFLPLEDAIALRDEIRGIADNALMRPLMSFQMDWVHIFADLGGEVFVFDPAGNNGEGWIVRADVESGLYQIYPSVRNVLAGAIECFEKGVYTANTEEEHILIDVDIDREWEIMERFGSEYIDDW